MPWHLTQSSAFRDILAEPVAPWLTLRFIPWSEAAAAPSDGVALCSLEEPMVFCQVPPPLDALRVAGGKVVWVAMCDQAAGYTQEWWNELPKTLRILAFSRAVSQRATQAGLQTLEVQYHIDVARLAPAVWDSSISLLYWNRTGLVSPGFLKELCAIFKIDHLYFRGDVDPGVPADAYYRLPRRLGRTRVHDVSGITTRDEYLEVLQRCNLFLAPRNLEGVGLSYLEAMAAGCAVIAFDGPTMNEYIRHGVNGLLARDAEPGLLQRLAARAAPARAVSAGGAGARGAEAARPACQLLDHCDRRALGHRRALRRIGDEARRSERLGFARWEAQRQAIADFILDW